MKYEAMNVLTGEIVQLEGVAPVFNSVLVHPPVKAETSNSEDTKTEQGYIPPEAQIRDMERAGLLLQAQRRGRFDSDLYPDGTLDLEMAIDPFREMGADMVDLVKAATQAGENLRNQDRKAREAAAAAEQSRKEKATAELSASLVGKTAQEIEALLKTSSLTGSSKTSTTT